MSDPPPIPDLPDPDPATPGGVKALLARATAAVRSLLRRGQPAAEDSTSGSESDDDLAFVDSPPPAETEDGGWRTKLRGLVARIPLPRLGRPSRPSKRTVWITLGLLVLGIAGGALVAQLLGSHPEDGDEHAAEASTGRQIVTLPLPPLEPSDAESDAAASESAERALPPRISPTPPQEPPQLSRDSSAPPPPPPIASGERTAVARAPRSDQRLTLRPAPDPGLVEQGSDGPLPIVGTDGREPWRVYARPFDSSLTFPRIAIVVTGLGLSSAATQMAIQRLPGSVTLAFAPNARNLERDISAARAAGHEILIDLPMEPQNFPRSDPGPFTLLTSLSVSDNLERMEWTLSRGSGYVGVVNFLGARFATSVAHLEPVLRAIKERGLMFVDSRPGAGSRVPEVAAELGLPFAVSNGFVDDVASRMSIDAALVELERIARETGAAVGMALPYPVSIERLLAWIPTLPGKGLVLAPVSALAGLQMAQVSAAPAGEADAQVR